MYDHNTQRPRGFGFITYDSEEAVDKVLLKTFHELNGKMVEVKRAVPKELSPGPSRGQLGAYNYGLNRVSSFLNGYNQGYNPGSVAGYGVRIDGRYSPVTVGRNGFSPIGPGYGMGLNFEPNVSPSYGGSATLSSNLSYARGLNPTYTGNLNRFNSPIGYGANNGGNNSLLSSPSRTLWGNGNMNYSSNSTNTNSLLGLGSGGSSGMGSFGNIGAIWGTSPNSGLGGAAGSAYSSDNISYGTGEFSVASGGLGYGRSSGTGLTPSSASNGGFDEGYADIYENGSLYGDSTWRSSSPLELEGSNSFGFGLGSTDVMAKNPAGYIGGYGVPSRQPTRGKMFLHYVFSYPMQQ